MTSGVFNKVDVAGPEYMQCSVAQTDLALTGKGYDELALGALVPVDEVARFVGAKGDVGCLQTSSQLRIVSQIHVLNVGLAVVSCVHSGDYRHVYSF